MSELSKIINSIKVYLETDKLAGIQEIVSPSRSTLGLNQDRAGVGQKETRLEGLKKETGGCKGCPLYKKRTNLVFGTGSPKARLMFIGEAPGGEEDLQGVPFVGRAGVLLTKMIEAMGLKRKDVYIANVLKCRPPNNRNPLPEEISSCSRFLLEQIRIIRPKVICLLGKFAAQFLLKSQQPITALRGKFYDFDGIKTMPAFHPAYLLRNPNSKRLAWEDLKKIRDELKK